MLRGVNRRVLEVTETEHEIFEKAILFVKEGAEQEGEPRLRQEAVRYLRTLHYRPPRPAGLLGPRARFWLRTGGAAVLGAALMALVQH